MNNGRWVIGFLFLATIPGGVWIRSAAVGEWELTQRFYATHDPILARVEHLHRAVRTSVASRHPDPAALAREATELHARVERLDPPNGRTMRARDAEESYSRAVVLWATTWQRTGVLTVAASPSFTDLEIAYGWLRAQTTLEDKRYRWHVMPAPGTEPTPTPRRMV